MLPRFRRAELEREQAKVVERELQRAIDEGIVQVPATNGNGATRDPVDAVRLRGLPAVGSGAAGAIRGTIPHVDGLRFATRYRRRL